MKKRKAPSSSVQPNVTANEQARTPDEQALVDSFARRPKLARPVQFKKGEKEGQLSCRESDHELAAARAAKSCGVGESDLADALLMQLIDLDRTAAKADPVKAANKAMAWIHGISPNDPTEAMLAAQMIASHQLAMNCFTRAMLPDQSFEARHANLRQGAKLSRLYADQMQALAKYRNRGQQTVRVEHVTVNGHANFGTVNQATSPKPGEGAMVENGVQPHEQQPAAIPFTPVAPVWSEDQSGQSLPGTGDAEWALPPARR
ncbi:hypothetical protein WV31_18100 [Magnetospirillum sp. ME-1]|uniref:hypothetical protein n=1 Tax=Magnetospirillum sp. ME-1 TaxID=1639348 RepID=UPI000A17ACC0|nr:hypothetical protein [Magnetospirillum sp. ME-1]ARJ67440.1 hypothetical protein WV31_18100 [Magnetospirillum sp. ME-1]